jgi:hypothetical protein
MNAPTKWKAPSFKSIQPVVLFVVGIIAFGWQVIAEQTDRPYLLALIAGMIGLPFVILADKARNAMGGQDEKSSEATKE